MVLCDHAFGILDGNSMLQGVARLIMKVTGWTALGGIPDVPKAVIIAAPHTSNWDAFWAIVYVVASGNKDIRVFAKHSLFWFPLGSVLRSFGCMPLDRSRATSVVKQAIDTFKSKQNFYLALAPEGTRSRAQGWKSGFYRIALGAEVPVIMGTIDYRRKRVGLEGRIELTGDTDADMERLAEFYEGIEGRRPENAGPVRMQKGRKRR